MKAYVFVEGESDARALGALWQEWKTRLRRSGHGIALISLADKARFLRKIGARAAEKLAANPHDVAVGLPDLHPRMTSPAACAHATLAELQRLQFRLVKAALQDQQRMTAEQADLAMERFCGAALKHDLEMLLLAAKDDLRAVLRTPDQLHGAWRIPVEDQNDDRPPKRVVEQLFRTKHPDRRRYRDTTDAPNVLGRVVSLAPMLTTSSNQPNCPEFARMTHWLGEKLRIPMIVPR